jgi:hypothetical protein
MIFDAALYCTALVLVKDGGDPAILIAQDVLEVEIVMAKGKSLLLIAWLDRRVEGFRGKYSLHDVTPTIMLVVFVLGGVLDAWLQSLQRGHEVLLARRVWLGAIQTGRS